MQKQMGRFK